MSLACPSRLEILRDRGERLAAARAFFAEKNILEVDTPLLNRSAAIDPFIDLIEGTCLADPIYLMSSPEHGMKRLLAEGMGDIYQLSHVYRDGERGARHIPEFMMAEWYRVEFSLTELIAETAEFLGLFVEARLSETLLYKDLLLEDANEVRQDEVFSTLGHEGITAVIDFPADNPALAEVEGGVTKRFELFYQGVELANGYQELRDAEVLRRRFEDFNRRRKEALPIDEALLAALPKMPPCCGVAVGIDRLMMLRHGAKHINEVIPLPW